MRWILAFLIFALMSASATAFETGFLDRTVSVAGVEYRYQVYVPRIFNAAQRWPVILALHGGGDYGSDGLRQTNGALAEAIRSHSDRFPALVVFPQAHDDRTPGWQRQGGDAALAALDRTIAEFRGDPARIYLTGYSAGGNGAWSLLFRYPQRFAAVVVVSGFIGEFTGKTSGVKYPALVPASDGDPYTVVAKRVKDVPAWLVHGDADQTVSVEESRHMAAALKAWSGNVHYIELSGVGHAAWDAAYNDPEMTSWLLAQSRH